MHPRAIWAIGCGQLVNWGVLFFAFGVLLVPLQDAFVAIREHTTLDGSESLRRGNHSHVLSSPVAMAARDRRTAPAVSACRPLPA